MEFISYLTFPTQVVTTLFGTFPLIPAGYFVRYCTLIIKKLPVSLRQPLSLNLFPPSSLNDHKWQSLGKLSLVVITRRILLFFVVKKTKRDTAAHDKC